MVRERLFSAINNISDKELSGKVAPNPTNEATNHALETSRQKEDRSLYKGDPCVINLYNTRFLTFVNASGYVDNHLCTRISYISPRIFPIIKSIIQQALW